LGKLCFAIAVARFLSGVCVDWLQLLVENCCFVLDEWFPKVLEGMLSAGLEESMFFVEFAKTVGSWLLCNGTTEIGLGCSCRLVGKVRDRDISGGDIDTAAFLVGEEC
jgi:hypothetical protein